MMQWDVYHQNRMLGIVNARNLYVAQAKADRTYDRRPLVVKAGGMKPEPKGGAR
jgi:hypothetical protein